MGRRVNIFLFLILLAGAIARLRGLMNPLLDDQGWRQADTASMALHMLGRLTNFPDVFFPTLNYDGAVPQKVELEFPILPYLLAWTWTLLGWADYWGRLWSIGFSLWTIWGIYEFGKRSFSQRAGLWAAGIFALSPLAVYYGRVVMPEPVTQAFSIWALNIILRWRETNKEKELILAGVLMSLAILAKLPQLMLFPVAIVLGFWPFKAQRRQMFKYSLLSLGLPMLYYIWVHLGANQAGQFVSGILAGQIAKAQVFYIYELKRHLREGVTFPGLVLALAGIIRLLFLAGWSERGSFRSVEPVSNLRSAVLVGILVWLVVTLMYIAIVCISIPLDYYLMPALPLIALLAGFALDILEDIPGLVSGILVLSVLWFSAYLVYEPKYVWDERYLWQAGWLKENTSGNSVLILSDPPPMTLYYARRVGFRLISPDDLKAWEDLENLKGNYLVKLPNSKRKDDFWTKVRAKYPEIGPEVYDLNVRYYNIGLEKW